MAQPLPAPPPALLPVPHEPLVSPCATSPKGMGAAAHGPEQPPRGSLSAQERRCGGLQGSGFLGARREARGAPDPSPRAETKTKGEALGDSWRGTLQLPPEGGYVKGGCRISEPQTGLESSGAAVRGPSGEQGGEGSVALRPPEGSPAKPGFRGRVGTQRVRKGWARGAVAGRGARPGQEAKPRREGLSGGLSICPAPETQSYESPLVLK